MKTMKFRKVLADLVLKGEKTSTWRLFDDKDLTEGDEVEMLIWETKEPFADAEMYSTYAGCYGQNVDQETMIKIIRFELV